MSKKLKLFVMMLTCILLNVNYAWATDFEWTFPLSSTANSAYEDDDEQDATIIVKTSKGATHGGGWSHRTGVGSHFNVSAGGYFYISVPITNSTTSFTLQADIYGWKSSKYVAKNCTIKYYTSKLSTEAAVCNGATTTSGCYAVDQEITLPSTYKPTGSGTLYIKIYPEGGNIGFESLSVTICPTCGGSTKTVSYAAGDGSGTNPGSHTGVTPGSSITLKENTFTAPAGKQFAGWNDGSTTRAAGSSYTVSDDVTMTAVWECITPIISSQSIANAPYTVGQSPANLSVTASGGTLSYQWKQCATENGTYVNVTGGTGGTTATYTPPTSAASDLWYQCTVTNTGSSCNMTVTSNKAHIVVNPASTWKFKYSGDDYDPHTMTEEAGVASYSISLAADTRFNFCIDDNGTAYKNNGTIITTTSGWIFNTTDGNCNIHTGPAGTYTFAINTTSKAVTVTYPDVSHPNDHYVYFKNTNVWGTVYGYLGNTGNDNKAAPWPGSVMQPTTTICGETYHYAALNAMSGTYNVIVFNNNDGSQTSDLSADGLGKFNANQDANWHDFKYSITFAGNGNTGGSMTNVSNICIGNDQTLASNGYTKSHNHFTGWTANVDVKIGGETVTAGTLIANGAMIQDIQQNIALTAQWEINSHTLTWNWGGGSTSSTTHTAAGTYNYGTTITYPADNTMSRDGYAFTGWSSSPSTMPDNDLTITAQWAAKEYNVTLDREGASTGSESVTMTYNSSSHTAITAPTKTGYDFGGWYTGDDGTGDQVMDASGVLQANVDGYTGAGGVWTRTTTPTTLYAKWTLKTTTVSFDQNGGTGGQTSNVTATYGQAMPSTPVACPTRAGYTFTGYFENSGGTGTKYYNADGSSATNWNKENSTWTLYAGWTAKEDTYKTALHTGASGWTSYASGVTKSGAGYTIPAPSSVTKGVGSTCEDLHYHFAGWVADDYKGSPSGHIITATGTTDATGTTYWAVWEKEAAGGGGTSSITITRSTTGITATGYDSGAERTWTQSEIDFGGHYIMTNNKNTPSRASASQYIVMQKSNGTLYNTEELPGAITEVQVVQYSELACNVYCGDERLMASDNTSTGQTPSGTLITKPDDATTMTWTISASNNYRFFALKAYTSSSSGTNYITSVKVTYSTITYEDPKAVCEACVATPSISGVSLTGSAFSTTSVPVQATGASAGDNCSLASYGFYWGTSASPTTNNTASDNLSTGTFSATLTGPFTIGETYHYRAYATNEAPNTGYSSDATFTLRQVSFNMHNHGGDAPATQVVPQGGKATDPGNPSATGWTFGGWYDNDSYTGSAWDFSNSTVGSGNVTLHAKWTEKPKYTITLNAGNGTISDANWTNTSGSTYTRTQSNGDEAITLPTPSCNCSGWVFQGWSLTSKDNADSFTPDKEDGASFVPAANVTYYAVYRANATGGTTFNKITSTGDLTTGNYIFMSSGGYAMKNVVTSSRMDEVGGYTASNSSQTIDNANLVWTIAKFSSQVVIKNGANYLGIDADNNICLTTTPHFFTYTYNAGSSRWEFTSATKTSYQLVYSSYFKILTSQSTAIYLFKQGTGLTGNYYTNPDCSDISVTGTVSPVGSGTVTLTASSGKTGDKVYAMYTPDEDYNFDEWTISGTGSTLGSTTAVVTEITIGSANTTVTANFVAKDWKTITWKANGVALTGGDLGSASVKVENGFDITALPPSPDPCDGTSTTFMGWVAESEIWSGPTDDISGVTIYEDVSDFPTVTDDVTYHAVWARQNGSAAPATYAGTGVFTKITTLDELEVGAHYVLYGTKDDDASVKGAMNNTFTVEASGKNVFGASAVTISDNKITNPATTIVWKLGGTTNAYTLYSQKSSKYVEITANDTRGYTNPSSPTTSFTITVSEGNFKIITNYASASSRMITIYTASVFRSYSYLTEGYTLNLYKYGSNYTYDRYLVKCCNTPTLTFAASPYAVLREDIQGASTTTWAEVDVTFSSNSSGTISAVQYSNATVTNGTAYVLAASKWQVYETTGGTLCGASHAYFEVLTQPSGATPGTGKFHVKTAGGQTGQGTYRIAITQAATDESHGNFCETTVYGFVDVTLRDKFVDNVNGNGTINRNGHGAQLATPTLSEFGTQEEDACHSEGRKLKGWIKETDLKAQYETGNSTRVQTVDGLCETCADGTDQTSLIVAPGTNVTMSGATWYAVWAYEK